MIRIYAWVTLFFMFHIAVVRAQQGPPEYNARWRVIDSLIEKKGLTASALTEVNKLYALARQEKNDPQVIKALIYRLNLGESTSEDGVLPGIKDLEKEVATTDRQPARSILQNILAGLYYAYLQQNRWKLYNRENLSQPVSTDPATWSADDFNNKITGLYLSSLKDEPLLTQTPLSDYKAIIIEGNASRLRPTLFDLLAHRALNYLMTGEASIDKPRMTFELDDPAAFADADGFAGHAFRTADSLSPQYKALLLFQRLIRLHLADKDPSALADLDIERIGWVNVQAIVEGKDGLYMTALRRLTDRYPALPAAAQAWYLQAQHYSGAAENQQNPADSDGNIKARAICERVAAQKDNSEGRANCLNLLSDILQKEVSLQTEKINIPYQPIRSLVRWRNITRLYMRLIRLNDPYEVMNGNTYDGAFWRRLMDMPVFRTFSQDLPDTRDYLQHSAEIAIASLPPGAYALVASNAEDALAGGAKTVVQYFSVSNISFINLGNDYFVLDRGSGHPMAGAAVQLYRTSYRSGKRDLIKDTVYTTDAEGHFLVKSNDRQEYGESFLEIVTPGDHLFPIYGAYPNYSYSEKAGTDKDQDKDAYEAAYAHTFYFTDRAIYRPGQTVYLKGIMVTRDFETHKSKVRPGVAVTVTLYNANQQKVDSLVLTTNEFGSFHGMFRLPEHQLNGTFRISDGNGSEEFSVEEYKRPSFFVEFEKPKDSYRLGDSIRVTGVAKGYAGNLLDGARVSYRVVRMVRFPHYWFFWRSRLPMSGEQEIAHGEKVTDGNGRFTIDFHALPDRAVEKSLDPEFVYNVTAEVTDINNETRNGGTTIAAGYAAVRLSIDLSQGERLAVDSFRRIGVNSSNYSGEPVESTVHLSIYALKSPGRLIRSRLWEAPDRWIIPEKEWLDSFPHDEYRQETAKVTWERDRKVCDTVLTGRSDTADLNGVLTPGWYLVEAQTSDKYGQEVKEVRYVELFDGRTGRPGAPEYNWDFGDGMTIEPGGRATVEAGSSAPDVYVIRGQEHIGQDIPRLSHFTLNGEKRGTSWDIGETDRGGFTVIDAFVKDNRLYTHSSVISVPWTNKQLDVRFATYRDKTLPGSGESWRMTITGYHGEKVSAEILTAMYDASLDQFRKQSWNVPQLNPGPPGASWSDWSNFSDEGSRERYFDRGYPVSYYKTYDQLMMPAYQGGWRLTANGKMYFSQGQMKYASAEGRLRAGIIERNPGAPRPLAHAVQVPDYNKDPDGSRGIMKDTVMAEDEEAKQDAPAPAPIQARKDFRETAFFFPDLYTDSAGSVTFSFTMPEALTTWKWMTLAHTRDLAFGYGEKTVVTQKQLMVEPNAPRFLREGDRMELPVKVVNLTDSELTGQMSLQLTDPTTGETADGIFTNRQPNQYFTVGPKQSVVVGFPLDIPYQYNRPLTYKVVAQARDYSDGEEATLPVVSNRLLVTESLPLNMSGDGTKSFTFGKLIKSGSSETLNTHTLTVEFTANPAWYAVEALPYLVEYPHECAEQLFERVYANALAGKIAGANPRLQQVFERWRTEDTSALLSNLQKNQELKTVLLEETPWVLQGKSEAQQKKNIALLFDMDRLSGQLASAMDRFAGMQLGDGSFPWFKGGPGDRYITQYVLTGIGHLMRLQAIPPAQADKVKAIIEKALPYLDGQVVKDYKEELRAAGSVIDALAVQYLYMRSLFSDYGIPGGTFAAVNYYRKKARQSWLQTDKYLQGMIALALYRTGDVQTAKDIIASLKENAIRDAEKGMYWKGMEGGYYWYQAPIETQSLLIEAFHEISGDAAIDRELKTWLLRNKQTNSWPTTTATADACYALLMGNRDWLNVERTVGIALGDKTVEWSGGEAGSGYNKKVYDAPFVQPSMGTITVTMKTKTGDPGLPAWGAVYWQYFDQLDRITPPGSGKAVLSIVKKLFIRRNTDKGPVLEAVPENGTLKPGDKVVVRIELRADRDLEYVHMKDMRAACLEPVDVISGYRWQDGLGYYESTKDASTDFFFSRLPRGTYVFEYQLMAGQIGNFSNGITTIECMYAPEFTWHSEGIRVNVEAGP